MKQSDGLPDIHLHSDYAPIFLEYVIYLVIFMLCPAESNRCDFSLSLNSFWFVIPSQLCWSTSENT